MWRRKKSKGTPLMASAAGLAFAGLVGAAELGRRLFRNATLFSPSPDPALTWNPADYGLDPGVVEEITFRSDGEVLYGWYCRAEKPIASALFCHGKTGNFTASAEAVCHLVEHGISVFVFDYRGFGKSTGRPSIRGVVRDAVAASRRHDLLRPQNVPSILYGYSLGGAIAAQTAQLHEFDGLILQSTFTNLPDIARTYFPRLPMHLVSGRELDTLRVVSSLKIPLYVIHGTADETVPCSMGCAIYDSCPAEKAIEIIRDGEHKNLFDVAADRIVGGVIGFVTKLGPRSLMPRLAPSEETTSQSLGR